MNSCILSVGFFVLLQDVIRASSECSFPFLCPVAIAVCYQTVSFGIGGKAENFTLYTLRFGIMLEQKVI